jgi:L-ribulose-5-phosphate 3-epimerase UlaE
LGGATVPFGQGDTNFILLIKLINEINYDKNFILQGARSYNNKHSEALIEYKKFLNNIFNKAS